MAYINDPDDETVTNAFGDELEYDSDSDTYVDSYGYPHDEDGEAIGWEDPPFLGNPDSAEDRQAYYDANF